MPLFVKIFNETRIFAIGKLGMRNFKQSEQYFSLVFLNNLPLLKIAIKWVFCQIGSYHKIFDTFWSLSFEDLLLMVNFVNKFNKK